MAPAADLRPPSRALRARRLDNARRLLDTRVEIVDGRALTAAALREMNDFRRGIMTMKPEIDLAADHARFTDFVSRCPLVMRARDRGGALRGTFVARWVDALRGGRPTRLVMPEYTFFDPSLRGSGAFPWAVLRALAARPDVLAGREVYLGGVGYPTGVLAVDGIFGPTRFAADPDLDAATRAALDEVAAVIAGDRLDPATGRVWMPTRPPRPGPRWFARMASRRAFARYESLCPDWLDGYALPVVFRLRARDAAGAVRRSVTRSLRARWEPAAS